MITLTAIGGAFGRSEAALEAAKVLIRCRQTESRHRREPESKRVEKSLRCCREKKKLCYAALPKVYGQLKTGLKQGLIGDGDGLLLSSSSTSSESVLSLVTSAQRRIARPFAVPQRIVTFGRGEEG